MRWKETLGVWAFGWLKIPMIAYLRPRVERLDNEVAIVRIPFRHRSRNHLRSMYFGALAVGADLAGGIIAMRLIEESRQPVSLVFQGFKAEFHRRPTADVHFTCTDGAHIRAMVQQAIDTGERVTEAVTIVATTPSVSGDEAVATMELMLSLKRKAKAGDAPPATPAAAPEQQSV